MTGPAVAGAEEPMAFTATTSNVYAAPAVRPSNVTSNTSAPTEREAVPGDALTTYPVTGLPPSATGADQDTLAEATPATADAPWGADARPSEKPGDGASGPERAVVPEQFAPSSGRTNKVDAGDEGAVEPVRRTQLPDSETDERPTAAPSMRTPTWDGVATFPVVYDAA